MLFLQILFGFILAIVLVIAVAYFWIRFKIGKLTSSFSVIASHLPPIEARIHLEATTEEENDLEDDALAEFHKQQKSLAKAGFKYLGSFQAEDTYLSVNRSSGGIFGIVKSLSNKTFIEYCALEKNNCTHLATSNPVLSEINTKSLKIAIADPVDPLQALSELSSGKTFLDLSIGQFVLLYERIHATSMDSRLADPQLSQMVTDWIRFNGLEKLSDADMEDVLDTCKGICEQAIDDAILDNLRKSRNLDENSWSRIENELLILRRETTFDELSDYFDDDLVDDLLQQFEEQKMTVSKAFNATNKRVKKSKQFTLLTTLQRPAHAKIYVRSIHLESIDGEAPEIQPGPGLQRFLYQSKSADEQLVRASLVAANVADVRAQLQRMGHTDVKVLSANHDLARPDEIDMELFAKSMIDAQSDSWLKTLFRIILSNWIVWLPFTLWAAWSLLEGPPLDGMDWLAITLAVISLAWVFNTALPSLLYNAFLEARSWGKTDKARKYFKLMRRFANSRFPDELLLDTEETKLLAESGHSDQAISLLDQHRDELDTIGYLGHLAQIHEAACDYQQMIQIHTEMVEEKPENLEFRIELALSLLRYTNKTSDAENLLKGLHHHECSEIHAHGLSYAQGLLNGKQGQFTLAINKLQKALKGLQDFNNPLVHAMQAEISGYMVIFLQKLGDLKRAEEIWQQVSPRLIALKAEHLLTLYRPST